MINLQSGTVKGGTKERKFADQLEKENIPYKFGRYKAYGESHETVFLVDNYAVSFDKFSPTIEKSLRDNKMTPQVWHQSELQWQDLSLDRRFKLHQ